MAKQAHQIYQLWVVKETLGEAKGKVSNRLLMTCYETDSPDMLKSYSQSRASGSELYKYELTFRTVTTKVYFSTMT